MTNSKQEYELAFQSGCINLLGRSNELKTTTLQLAGLLSVIKALTPGAETALDATKTRLIQDAHAQCYELLKTASLLAEISLDPKPPTQNAHHNPELN